MSLFDKFQALEQVREELLRAPVSPVATPIETVHSATRATIDGREVLLAGTNNYLGLTFHPRILAAATEAIRSQGSGTTGSRMANGSYAVHRALESDLATAWGWPSAIVFSTGYQANLGVLSGLAGQGDVLLIDADCHASIYDGCRLSTGETLRFRHNDPDSLDQRLRRLGERSSRTLVVVEGLYSMLGDQPPLAELAAVTRSHGAWLMVDEAHSFGVFGERGLGLSEQLGLLSEVDFIVGTFSKSLAGVGGFCVSRHAALEMLRAASRPYIFSASPAPAMLASTREALKLVLSGTALRSALWRNIHRLYEALPALGFRLGSDVPGPVVALLLPDRTVAAGLWQALLEDGIYTNLMLPPATPNGECLLRISVSAAHTDEDIDSIIAAFARQAVPLARASRAG